MRTIAAAVAPSLLISLVRYDPSPHAGDCVSHPRSAFNLLSFVCRSCCSVFVLTCTDKRPPCSAPPFNPLNGFDRQWADVRGLPISSLCPPRADYSLPTAGTTEQSLYHLIQSIYRGKHLHRLSWGTTQTNQELRNTRNSYQIIDKGMVQQRHTHNLTLTASH